jgi:hypothetical protein
VEFDFANVLNISQTQHNWGEFFYKKISGPPKTLPVTGLIIVYKEGPISPLWRGMGRDI